MPTEKEILDELFGRSREVFLPEDEQPKEEQSEDVTNDEGYKPLKLATVEQLLAASDNPPKT